MARALAHNLSSCGCRYGAIFVRRKKKKKKKEKPRGRKEVKEGGKRLDIAAESPRC